jgi:hypothetical protein
MPQLQNLVLQDQAATPASHTFVPRDIIDGVGAVIETTGVPIGNSTLTVSSKQSKTTGKWKVIVKIVVPVVATQVINGVSTPVVARTAFAELTLNFESTSTLQERKDIVAFMRNSLATTSALTYGAATDLSGIY